MAIALPLGLATGSVRAEQVTEDASWTFAPYAWILNLRGTVGIEGLTVPFDVGVAELAGKVNAGGMGYARWMSGPHMVYAEGLGIRFHDDSLDLFRNLPVSADALFLESGYGRRIAMASALPNGGDILITPYLGVRYASLDVEVTSRLRQLKASEEWIDPVLGIIVEGPLVSKLEYAFKLDAAGFGVGRGRYASGAAYFTYRFARRWRLGAGYRAARFDAHPGGSNDLKMDLDGSGPVVGLAYSF